MKEFINEMQNYLNSTGINPETIKKINSNDTIEKHIRKIQNICSANDWRMFNNSGVLTETIYTEPYKTWKCTLEETCNSIIYNNATESEQNAMMKMINRQMLKNMLRSFYYIRNSKI